MLVKKLWQFDPPDATRDVSSVQCPAAPPRGCYRRLVAFPRDPAWAPLAAAAAAAAAAAPVAAGAAAPSVDGAASPPSNAPQP